ncbi:hypothetical protein [Microbacterium sp.]|uniref:hypothetical protein n=1 Tax=Microbacterium sp. TaxID=51671 RepID=UPI003F99CB64
MNARVTKRRAAGVMVCTAFTVGLAALTASPAAAAPDEAIGLSWDGESFAAQTTESFLGMPVTVPGDRAERTLTVRNDGPSAGTFTATITDVELLETAGGTPDTFYDDVTIEWPDGSASLADLAADDETTIEELELARGEIATITIGYDFPAEATSGNSSEVGARSAAFDVTLALAGETPAADDGDGLAVTGGAPALWLAIVGAALIPLGLALSRFRRDARQRR